MASRSRTHLVLIPSYNPGAKVYETVRAARRYWNPVWVIVDGSTDGTAGELQRLADADPGLSIIVIPHNAGKGAAVLRGLDLAAAARLHACAVDGFRRPASGRSHPGFHGRLDARSGLHDPRPAGVRRECAGAASQGSAGVELVGESRNAVGRHRRFAVRLPRLSDRPAAPGHASPALHAPLRFRPGSGRAPVLDAASSRSICRRPSGISAPRKAASRTSATCATTRC